MARKRMIDPKFWTDDKVIELKRDSRLLFIGMWNFSNDLGLHINNDKVLKAEIYPADEDITMQEIQFMKKELIEFGLIVIGRCNITDTSLIKITNWNLYQKISKPQPSKYDFDSGMVDEQLSTSSQPVTSNEIECNRIEVKEIEVKEMEQKEKSIVPKPKKTSGLKPYDERVKEWFGSIDPEFIEEMKEAYPNVNIDQELINAKMWLLTNTHKAKKYFKRFVNSWMSRQMERGGKFQQGLTTRDEVLAEKTEQLVQKEKNERIEMQKEAEKNAASSEEIQSTINDTLKELKKRKIERLKNVTNIQDQESKNPN